MLQVKNLSTWIQTKPKHWLQVLDNVNFSIEPGEIFALLGESGSGKTMTALALLRLLPTRAKFSQQSRILLGGDDLLNLPENNMRSIRGADIAMIFQDPMTSLNPVFTVGSQIVEVLNLHCNLKGRYAYIEALRLLELVRISDPVHSFERFPHELSGGMRQRIMMAMALACKPSLLIADEPTTALDVTTQAQILQLLKDLQKSEALAVMLITHDLAIAAHMADKIAVMQAGKIVEANSTKKFFAAPQHPYSQQLLHSLPGFFETASKIATKPSQVILKIQDLKVYFPIKKGLLKRTVGFTKAVDGISFDLYAGKTTAIVGESGSGKTTVAKAILALLPNVTGSIEYAGNLRTDVQIIFQDPYTALDPKLRIIASLEEGLIAQHKMLTTVEHHDRIDQLLLKVGLLPEHKWRYPHEFSGGERQRICIARALTTDPKIIICDEPTSSLDVSVQAQVLRLLQDLQRSHNLTYLFISHDLQVVRILADYIAVMYAGKIVEYGETLKILTHPQHPYTKELLAAVLDFQYAPIYK